MTVTNGLAQNEDGGGIRATAPLTLNRIHLDSNTADGADSEGGGIFTNSDLSVVRSTISNNQASHTGGGIRADFVAVLGMRNRDASIRESTISSNTVVKVEDSTSGIEIDLSYNAAILHSTIAFNEPRGLRVGAGTLP